jgi:restriction system protein
MASGAAGRLPSLRMSYPPMERFKMHPAPMPAIGHMMTVAILQALLKAWPFFVLALVIVFLRTAISRRGLYQLRSAGMDQIDGMDGVTFERRLKVLFSQLGYSVEETPRGGDFGGDLVLCKDGIRTVVQAKRWKRPVGVKAIQEAAAARGYYGCSAAMVVTNSRFTERAQQLARANNVVLWDRSRLAKAWADTGAAPVPAPAGAAIPFSINTGSSPMSNTGQPAPAIAAAAAAWAMPFATRPGGCATCSAPVSDAVRKFCLDRPGRFSGQVYCLEHQRSR